MCRIAAYLGPPTTLSALLDGSDHGLLVQSYAPREMSVGLLNADGWGVGWFAHESATPGLLKGTLPLWSDENAREAAPAIAAGAILAAVRAASPGLGVSWANTPPYRWNDHLFAHNGRIWPWTPPLIRAIRDRVHPEDEATLRGTTDSEWLGALWRTLLRESGGAADHPARGLRDSLRYLHDLTARHGGGVSANLALLSPRELLAARFAEPGPAPSLYVARDWRGGAVVASEPLDSGPGWEAVPPSSLVRVTAAGVAVEPF